MCCLFGIVDYGNTLSGKTRTRMLSILAKECEARGTDATGIAYVSAGRLQVYKRPLPARRMHFVIPGDAKVIMGHTRLATQGSAKRNFNNHPFAGRCGGLSFALAHNGVIYNDHSLQRERKLPVTNVQTDSYVAVQLLQTKGTLGLPALKELAETVEGSFSFTLLDRENHLYFIKGDNPLCIYYYSRLDLYVYASTAEILNRAVSKMRLPRKRQQISLISGDILRLSPDGTTQTARFDTAKLNAHYYYDLWSPCLPYQYYLCSRQEDSYLDELKSVAGHYGYTPDDVDTLLADGFSAEEVEEMFYCGEI
jgi:glucosamine 6-phosphate synthetase-like amidotransferase/phosphosugar isomerase protein